MRRWWHLAAVIALGVIVLAGVGGLPVRAQDEAVERILAAYRAYEEWDTYTVQGEVNARDALVADGTDDFLWQTRERHLTLSGWYDVTQTEQAMVLLTFSDDESSSTETSAGTTPGRWDVELNVALVNGETFWRGELQAASAAAISVPAEWTAFSLEDANAQSNLADLGLGRYLLQDERDPFVGDYEAWLDAARSIEGPETIRINRSTSGDLYLIEIELEDAPDVLADRFRALTEGPDALVSRETLLAALFDDSTMLWGVVLHPETGRLLGQYIQLDLTARLGRDAISGGYRSLTLETSDEQSVLFTGVNEPVDTTALPSP